MPQFPFWDSLDLLGGATLTAAGVCCGEDAVSSGSASGFGALSRGVKVSVLQG